MIHNFTKLSLKINLYPILCFFSLQSSKSESTDVIAQVKDNHFLIADTENNKSRLAIQTQVRNNNTIYKQNEELIL